MAIPYLTGAAIPESKVRRSTTALLATTFRACVVARNSSTITGSLVYRTPIIVMLIAAVAAQGAAPRHRKSRCVRGQPSCLGKRPNRFAGVRANHHGDGIPSRALR